MTSRPEPEIPLSAAALIAVALWTLLFALGSCAT